MRVISIHMVMDVMGVEVVNWRETESKTRIESRTETLGNKSVLRVGKEEETPTPTPKNTEDWSKKQRPQPDFKWPAKRLHLHKLITPCWSRGRNNHVLK